MNKDWIRFHLQEAKEQIDDTLVQLDDADYDEVEFKVEIQHMLHHLHTAYNSRNVTEPEAIDEAQFHTDRRPPPDMDWQ